jgi:hypothetical protein
MTVATFDYTVWSARYPELAAAVDAPMAAIYFDEAGLYLNNTDASPVSDATKRGVLLNMLTAHIAAMNMTGSSALVGRINSATEGSVTVAAEYQVPGTAAWYAQTKYGAAYWQATMAYRMAKYVAPPCQPSFYGRYPWR